MLITGINLSRLINLPPNFIVREHAPHGGADHTVGVIRICVRRPTDFIPPGYMEE